MPVVLIVAVVVGVVAVFVVASYNRFVDERQTLTNSWSNVDTELQRRHDLVPNLVQTVKGYAAHERTTLEAVIVARDLAAAASSASAQAGAENQLVSGLRQLFALSEAYPDLRANQQFLDLHQQLATTENRIQAARRVYNGNVRDYNRRVESIPSNVVAALFHFGRADYFELDPLTRAAGAPSVQL